MILNKGRKFFTWVLPISVSIWVSSGKMCSKGYYMWGYFGSIKLHKITRPGDYHHYPQSTFSFPRLKENSVLPVIGSAHVSILWWWWLSLFWGVVGSSLYILILTVTFSDCHISLAIWVKSWMTTKLLSACDSHGVLWIETSRESSSAYLCLSHTESNRCHLMQDPWGPV